MHETETDTSAEGVLIPIANGRYVAIVDAADAPRVREHKWSVAACSPDHVYATRTVRTSPAHPWHTLGMHRFILDAPDGVSVDHANGNTLDNRRCNLRLATASQQTCNRRKPRGSRTPYKGVQQLGRGRWTARVSAHLGVFSTPEEAARAYDAAALHLHGAFARLNFPAPSNPVVEAA